MDPEDPAPLGGGPLASSDSALLETLVLEALVGFAFYGTDLRYRRINRMLADINGLSMEAHLGRRPTEVLPPELGRAIEAMLSEVLRTGQAISDDDFTVASTSTGEVLHYQSQWYPARAEDGSVLGIAVLVSDVTDRRRSEEALRRSQDRTEKLQRATAALAEALTVDDVRAAMRRVAQDALGSSEAQVLMPAVEASAGPPAAAGAAQARGPHVRDVLLPLVGPTGPIGTLWLRLDSDGRRGEDEAFLGALAGQCAIALERARLYERERSTAVALQQSLLPDRLPTSPEIELAAHFRPGSEEADVGGDWYDAFALPDGRIALVVGDVMGKGVVAAAGMGRLRAAMRALALVNPLPEAVLQGLDRMFTATEEPEQIATLVYLLVHPRARRIAIGGAGHLPLVLVRSGGQPQLVDAGSGSTPLGWPEPRSQQTLELGPGDLILGVTDGVVERRGSDLDEGLAELLASVREPAESLTELVERVAAAMLDESVGRDDATLLAARFVT